MTKYKSIYSSDWEDLDDFDEYTGYHKEGSITTSKWNDWYDRGSFGGEKKKRTSTLGWDRKITYGGAYSSYFLGDSYSRKSYGSGGNLDLVKKYYPQAKDLITILDLPFKVNIQISPGTSSYSDGRRVCVATKMFDDTSLSEAEKLDVFCGVTVHEGAHLMFTDFEVLTKFLSDLEYKSIVSDQWEVNMVKHIANIIEDERVEDQLSAARPGLSGFLEKSKYYYFEQLYQREMETEISYAPAKDTELMVFLDLMFKVIRYPKFIKSEVAEEHKDRLEKLKTWIVPLPKDTEDTLNAAVNIFKFLKEEFGSSIETERVMNQVSKILSELSSTPMYGKNGDSGNALEAQHISSDIKCSSDYEVGVLEGTIEKGLSKHSYFLKETVQTYSKSNYQKAYDRIKQYVPSIRKLVKNSDKNYDFVIKACRHGILDTSKLVEAYQGVPQVYQRKGTVTTNSTTICILVDESGSMTRDHKEERAKEAVILLNEAFGKLSGVDLYIYGHTADDEYYRSGGDVIPDTDLLIYREGKHFISPYVLGNITGRNENRDGVAIIEVAKRVRTYTQQPVLMFVISDGSPSATNYRRDVGVRDTREKVKEAEKMGFEIVQITIDDCPDAGDMFSKYIDLSNNIANMPIMLAKIIKKCVLDNKVTRVI